MAPRGRPRKRSSSTPPSVTQNSQQAQKEAIGAESNPSSATTKSRSAQRAAPVTDPALPSSTRRSRRAQGKPPETTFPPNSSPGKSRRSEEKAPKTGSDPSSTAPQEVLETNSTSSSTVKKSQRIRPEAPEAEYTPHKAADVKMPAPTTPAGDDSHQRLLDKLDLVSKPKPFKNPNWKPSQRRNKNIKQIVSEASRKEASALATNNNSGATTPNPSALNTGAATPQASNGANPQPSISLAAQSLSTMVLEKNMKAQQATIGSGPVLTWTNIDAAPSLHPGRKKRYCDITGLPAPYTDSKSRLHFVNAEISNVIKELPQGVAEKYLEARAAHVVLK